MTDIHIAKNVCNFIDIEIGEDFVYNRAKFKRVSGKAIPMYCAMAMEGAGYEAHRIYEFDRLCKVEKGNGTQVEVQKLADADLFVRAGRLYKKTGLKHEEYLQAVDMLTAVTTGMHPEDLVYRVKTLTIELE